MTSLHIEFLVNGKMPEKDFVAQALKNSYWLREETERLLKVKPWITPVVVFTKAFVIFGPPVKGVSWSTRNTCCKRFKMDKATIQLLLISG